MTLKLKFLDYFTNVWNQFDLFVYTLLAISVILRYCLTGDEFVWARMFYVSTLALFYLRFLQMFYVSKKIGPKVIMIRRMVSGFDRYETASIGLCGFSAWLYRINMASDYDLWSRAANRPTNGRVKITLETHMNQLRMAYCTRSAKQDSTYL